MSVEQRWSGVLRAVCVLGVCAASIIWFAMLNGRSLYDPDEGRYAEIPREMLLNHDWIIPHLNGLVYLEKPPLQYWLTALSFRFLGETEFAARLCTGLAGFLSLAIVFFLGRRLWGIAAGYKAVLLTAASTLFVLLGHQLTLDMLLSFWLLAFLACFLMAQLEYDSPRSRACWMSGCWSAIALAVLTKGLIGIVAPAATVLTYLLWQGDRRVLRRLNLRWGVPLLALIAVPWFVLAARANPAFLQFFIVREHFQRFLTPIEQRNEPWWFFFAVLIIGILPWAPTAARSLILAVRQRMPRGEFDAAAVLLSWCAFMFLFFSFSNAKLITYILPVVPALALLCARPVRGGRVDVGLGAALTLLSGAAILLATNSPWQSSKVAAVAVYARTALLGTGAVLTLGALATFELLRRRRDFAALSILCAAWFLTSLGITIGATDSQAAFSAKAAALALKSAAAAEAPVFSIQLYDQTLPFYLGRTVTLVSYRDEFSLGLDQDPARGIAEMTEFSRRWQELPQGYAVMRPLTRDLLLAQGLPMREIAQFENRVVESRR